MFFKYPGAFSLDDVPRGGRDLFPLKLRPTPSSPFPCVCVIQSIRKLGLIAEK